jgi:hypothetical protein
MTDWQTVGHAAVDSARLLISDPAYVEHRWQHGVRWDEDTAPGSYSDGGITAALFTTGPGPVGVLDHVDTDPATGLGVAVFTGPGDGVYPVQVTYTDTGHVAAVRVVFIPDAVED